MSKQRKSFLGMIFLGMQIAFGIALCTGLILNTSSVYREYAQDGAVYAAMIGSRQRATTPTASSVDENDQVYPEYGISKEMLESLERLRALQVSIEREYSLIKETLRRAARRELREMIRSEDLGYDETYLEEADAEPLEGFDDDPPGDPMPLGGHDIFSITHSGTSDEHAASSTTHLTNSDDHFSSSTQHETLSQTHTADSYAHDYNSDTHTADSYNHWEESDGHGPDSEVHDGESMTHGDGSWTHSGSSDTHYSSSESHLSNSDSHDAGSNTHTDLSDMHSSNSATHNFMSTSHASTSVTHYYDSDVHDSNSDHHYSNSDTHYNNSNYHHSDSGWWHPKLKWLRWLINWTPLF